MNNKDYVKADFEEAQTALLSTLHKCEKVQDSEKLGKSQRTSLDRRIRALRLALSLILFRWTSMIRQPEFVTADVFEWAKTVLQKKNPSLDLSAVRLEKLTEGLCA